MRANRIFRVNTNYNGRNWRWSVLAYNESIASGMASSMIGARRAAVEAQKYYMKANSGKRVWAFEK